MNADVPQFFRLNIEVGDLDAAADFYSKLLDLRGRRQPGSRIYFNAGPVTLQAQSGLFWLYKHVRESP